MSHPVYGIGTSALVYIGDQVSDRADGVPIGVVFAITADVVIVRDVADPTYRTHSHDAATLCLVRRADPNPKELTTMSTATEARADGRPCGPQIDHADGSWWAACDCGWIAATPHATEAVATTEWEQHVDQVTPW